MSETRRYLRRRDAEIHRQGKETHAELLARHREDEEAFRTAQGFDRNAPEPPEPEPPQEYEVREITEPTTIRTASGAALIMPPSLLVTGSDGEQFGVTPADLATGWTLVEEGE
jgi:hypothetical protein